MAKKKFKLTTTTAIIIAALVLVFIVVFATAGQTAQFFAARKIFEPRPIPIAQPVPIPMVKPVTVGLKVDESIMFKGKTVKLLNTASSYECTPNGAIIVSVDGVVESVFGTEVVNGVTIQVNKPLYWDVITLRYAIFTLS